MTPHLSAAGTYYAHSVQEMNVTLGKNPQSRLLYNQANLVFNLNKCHTLMTAVAAVQHSTLQATYFFTEREGDYCN